MEDFYYAGGLPVVIQELQEQLHMDALTVTGKSLAENIEGTECHNRDVIAPLAKPLIEAAGLAVLRGNLCEGGAIIKPSAATPELMQHKGRAVVFETIEDYNERIDSDDLDVDENSVLVLQNVGPVGYPGMAEVGNMGLPKKLLEKGVRDIVRISDGRMSGTAYGTVVLHVAPEAAIGGNLALVRTGDMIELDVVGRRLHLDVSDEELAERRAQWQRPDPHDIRGYVSLYTEHVLQADKGVDFDFLVGKSSSVVTREAH
jgi:dihydroxy-acid dehydratase